MSKELSPHEGKHFVIQKGKAQCNQGNRYPHFKVTSHQKHYWNSEDGQSDYLAVTEDDVQFTPSVSSFGQCKLKPGSGGDLPCAFVPSGKWQNPYDKTKVMNKSCITELSELMCTTGGRITVRDHGQIVEITRQNIRNADPKQQHLINPLLDYGEFQDEQEEDVNLCE